MRLWWRCRSRHCGPSTTRIEAARHSRAIVNHRTSRTEIDALVDGVLALGARFERRIVRLGLQCNQGRFARMPRDSATPPDAYPSSNSVGGLRKMDAIRCASIRPIPGCTGARSTICRTSSSRATRTVAAYPRCQYLLRSHSDPEPVPEMSGCITICTSSSNCSSLRFPHADGHPHRRIRKNHSSLILRRGMSSVPALVPPMRQSARAFRSMRDLRASRTRAVFSNHPRELLGSANRSSSSASVVLITLHASI